MESTTPSPSPWAWQNSPPSFLSSSLPDAVKPRIWSRPLWGGELTFGITSLLSPGSSDMLLSAYIDLPSLASAPSSVTLSLEQVRKAVRLLRWHHPSIATAVAFPPFTSLAEFKPDAGRLVYTTAAGEEEIQQWLDECVFDRSSYLTAEGGGELEAATERVKREQGKAGQGRSKWMFRVFYLGNAATNRHTVMVQTGHTICDGIGTFEVLDLLLHELAAVLRAENPQAEAEEVSWGEEGTRLDKALPERVDCAVGLVENPLANPVLRALYESSSMPPLKFGLGLPHPQANPSFTGTLLRRLPPPLASQLRQAARKHRVNVFSLLVAANYLSTLSYSPPAPGAWDGESELCARILPNSWDLRAKYLRGGVQAKKDRSTWQVALAYASGIVSCRNMQRFLAKDGEEMNLITGVWILAGEVQAQATFQGECMAQAAQWMPRAIQGMLAAFFSSQGVKPPEHKVVNLSSLGVMDDSLSAAFPSGSDTPVFTISQLTFSVISPTLPSPGEVGALFLPYTWQGTLHLSYSFPEAYWGSLEEQKEWAEKGEKTLIGNMRMFEGLLSQLAEEGALPN